MPVTLRPAAAGDRQLINNIYNLYQNDLGEYCGDFTYLDENGYFDIDASRDVLPFGDGVFAYIIENDGKNTGLVMVTDSRYALPQCDFKIEEMYIVRPQRKKGVAKAALKQIFDIYKGRFCLSVYKKNLPARVFWEKIVSEFGSGLTVSEGEADMLDFLFEVK